jgi:crotonobetainyl-CoA:carnitine CoA-transferase CaiB-like acyl-CoA transferase
MSNNNPAADKSINGPLSGLKVLDFSTLLPGPYATMLLADMGADVLRVESPTRLDLVRVLPPLDGKQSAAHMFLNRGKRSLALDLKKDGAADVVKALVREYDIVVEQFRPGVMARLGIDYASLKAINPRLIYCSITGYGQTGPYKDRAGHDINYLAISGVAGYSGRKTAGPSLMGVQVADIAGGSHHAVMSVLAAVIHRQATGEGQMIDISMTDAAFALNAMSGAAFFIGGKDPLPENEPLNGGGFYDYYETLDGRFLSVGGLEPQFVKALCEALGSPERTMQGMSQRPQDQQDFKRFLRDKISSRNYADWLAFFAELDVCVEPVLTMSEAAEHPQLTARLMTIGVPKADGTEQRQLGHPLKFSLTPCVAKYAGVPLGNNTEEVLQSLNLPDDLLGSLKQSRVFG